MPTAPSTYLSPSPCPLDLDPSTGELVVDPQLRWETTIRACWLAASSSQPRPPRHPAFVKRIETLQELVRAEFTAGSASEKESHVRASKEDGTEESMGPPPPPPRGSERTSKMKAKAKGKRKEASDEPDGGAVIRTRAEQRGVAESSEEEEESEDDEGGEERKRTEFNRARQSILLALNQGKALKEPLPLSLVVSLLYKTWQIDGTIPSNYTPSPGSPTISSPPSTVFPFAAYASVATTSLSGLSGPVGTFPPPVAFHAPVRIPRREVVPVRSGEQHEREATMLTEVARVDTTAEIGAARDGVRVVYKMAIPDNVEIESGEDVI